MAKRGQYKKNAKADSVQQRKYNSQAEQKKNRAARNKARATAERAGRVRKGDGKDVDHIRQLMAGGSRNGATRVTSRHANRSRGGRLGGKR